MTRLERQGLKGGQKTSAPVMGKRKGMNCAPAATISLKKRAWGADGFNRGLNKETRSLLFFNRELRAELGRLSKLWKPHRSPPYKILFEGKKGIREEGGQPPILIHGRKEAILGFHAKGAEKRDRKRRTSVGDVKKGEEEGQESKVNLRLVLGERGGEEAIMAGAPSITLKT